MIQVDRTKTEKQNQDQNNILKAMKASHCGPWEGQSITGGGKELIS